MELQLDECLCVPRSEFTAFEEASLQHHLETFNEDSEEKGAGCKAVINTTCAGYPQFFIFRDHQLIMVADILVQKQRDENVMFYVAYQTDDVGRDEDPC